MFSGQIQKYYFDMYNIEYNMKMIKKENDTYSLIDWNENIEKDYRKQFKDLIHIYDGKINSIGDDEYSLSSTWLKTKKEKVKILKNNTINYYTHIIKSPSKNNIWTTIRGNDIGNDKENDRIRKSLSGKGYTKGFVSCNARATNDYADRHCCAYLLNRYMNPMLKGFFDDKGIMVDEDIWAISELIQWLFRSAIRNKEEINLYIPSKRMRELLISWME